MLDSLFLPCRFIIGLCCPVGAWKAGRGVNLNNRTIIKISPSRTFPCVFRGSFAGLPRVEGMSTPPPKGTVLGRHRGVRGEGIKSQKCASVPACQQFSKIYTCVRARVYLWKLLARWHAGTPHFIPYLLFFYEFMSFYLHILCLR